MPEKPYVAFVGQVRRGPFDVVLVQPTAIIKAVGEPLMEAFSRCFYGIDRLMAFSELFITSLGDKPATETPDGPRKWMVLTCVTIADMFEMRLAIQKLRAAKVHTVLTDLRPWEELNAIQKRWEKDPLAKKIRNQLGHHLGDDEAYRTGVAAIAAENFDRLTFYEAKTHQEKTGFASFAWLALLKGLDLPLVDLATFSTRTAIDVSKASRIIRHLFLKVLQAKGIEVRDERTRAPGDAEEESAEAAQLDAALDEEPAP